LASLRLAKEYIGAYVAGLDEIGCPRQANADVFDGDAPSRRDPGLIQMDEQELLNQLDVDCVNVDSPEPPITHATELWGADGISDSDPLGCLVEYRPIDQTLQYSRFAVAKQRRTERRGQGTDREQHVNCKADKVARNPI
jgi:hypothetical protein